MSIITVRELIDLLEDEDPICNIISVGLGKHIKESFDGIFIHIADGAKGYITKL